MLFIYLKKKIRPPPPLQRIFCPPKMSKWKIQTYQITRNLKYQTVLRDVQSARHLHLCCTHKADAYWTLMMTWLVFVSSRFWSHPHDSTPEDKLLSSAGQNPSSIFRPFDQQQQVELTRHYWCSTHIFTADCMNLITSRFVWTNRQRKRAFL